MEHAPTPPESPDGPWQSRPEHPDPDGASVPTEYDGLNDQQRRFVEEYLVDLNATQAALRAGYSHTTAAAQGSRLLRKDKVQAALRRGTADRSARVEVTQDDVLREVARLGFYDVGELFDEAGALRPMRELPLHVRRAIVSVEVEEREADDGGRRGWVKKVKLADKPAALKLLAQHLGMCVQKVEHSGSLTLEQLVLSSFKKDGEG